MKPGYPTHDPVKSVQPCPLECGVVRHKMVAHVKVSVVKSVEIPIDIENSTYVSLRWETSNRQVVLAASCVL